MRAHMLSLLMYPPSHDAIKRMIEPDAHAWQREQDDLEAVAPAIVEHVNRHYHADPACETTFVKRLELGRKGRIRTFETLARFHGQRLQAEVVVTGTYDPATRDVHVKRLKERSVSRRGGTPVSAWRALLRKTVLFLHP